MKKSIALVFVLALALCSMAGAFAQSESDFKIEIAGGKVTITEYTGIADKVLILTKIGDCRLLRLGKMPFPAAPDLLR
ncbi:MAG: hypothetical protein Ta2G_20840 [Termitinemataceae bacterium]|nr:MAG: hypothetical protein Ta2G_20840 [Termitinemataceae bacterium]